MNKWLRNWQRWYLWVVLPLAGILVLWLAESALGDVQATVGNQITYQGTLQESGQPVSGTRNMTFRLYSDDACSVQVGVDIVRNGVILSDGYFSVFLDLNPSQVDGQALWLQVEVEGSVFECQAITAVPYALSLRPGAVIRGSTSSANGLVELENQGPGQAIRVTSTDGMVLYGTTAGGPAIYGYAGGGYGLRGVSSASGSAAVRGDTSTAGTFGGDFYSTQSSGVQGSTVSVQATPVPGVGDTYVAGVRGLAQSSGYVYGIYGETLAGTNGAGVHATNLGSGTLAPDLELGAGSNGNGVLASDQLVSSSDLVFLSNDDISLRLDADQSFETSQFALLDRSGAEAFRVDSTGNLVAQGTATAENGLLTGTSSGDGLFVFQAGSYGSTGSSGLANGVEVRSANNDGLMVGANGGDGVDIWNAGENGLYVRNAGGHGVFVNSATGNGIDIDNVGAYGIHVSDSAADNYFAGDTGIGTSAPTNRLHVRDSINGAASVPNHVALIENASTGTSPDVLVLKVGETAANIGGENNYISFVDGSNASLGAIQGTGSGGVTLAGPGSDYAEWLPRLDAKEVIQEGDVLGIFGGQVSKETAGADMIMAASTGPIVSGNDPGEGQREDYVLVAFIGQVEIRVRGPVQAGDFLVPSGLEDGTAVAVSPADLPVSQLTQVVGQAWESSSQPGIKPIRSLVGLVQPSAIAETLQSLEARLRALEEAMGLGESQP
jgi:hypothetical protein